MINRRTFIKVAAAGTGLVARPGVKKHRLPATTWHDVREWGVEGKGWSDTLRYFDRLPGKAKASVREPVWNLSRHSSGMCARFTSDASSIRVRYSLLKADLAMPHMPATGVSGLDLYAEDGEGVSRWVSVVQPTDQQMEVAIVENLNPGTKRFTLYLPLFNGVETLEIGVDPGFTFEPIEPRSELPVVFYGTSIMHGACASRPGIAFPSILGRRLMRPFINLAFSGNGRMESEVGALLAELEPCAYVIDCLPNMDETTVTERAAPLVRQLRGAHPKTPILLVEDRTFTNTQFILGRADHHRRSRAALRTTYAELLEAGVEGLYYLDGEHLLGHDGEGATDSSHPNDLGMMRYADAYEPALRTLLRQF